MADSYERVGADLIVRDFSRAGVTGFVRNMQLVRREVGGIQRTLGAAFGLGAGYLGMRGIIDGYKSVIAAAREAAQSDKLFRASMGDSAEATYEWSQRISDSMGVSAGQVRSNAATFKMMTENMGLTETQSISMAKALTQLTYDMASFRGVKPEEVFGDLQSGLAGSGKALQRMGIILKEEQLEQYAVDQGWIRHGQTLSETGKLYARFGLIMQQTAKDQGDAARSAGDAANMERRLAAQWGKVREELGNKLMPSYQQAMQTISGYLQTNMDDVRDWANETVDMSSAVVKAYAAAQHGFSNWFEKANIPEVVEPAARERYRTLHPEERDVFSQVPRGQGWGYHFEEIPPADPAELQRIRDQLTRETQMVDADRERTRLDRQKLSGQYELPKPYEPPAYPTVELPPDTSVFVDNTKEEAKATQQATDFVRKHIQALRDEYDMIGRRNTGYDDAQNYLETQRAILALTDQEVDVLLEELRTRQKIGQLTGKRKDLFEEMRGMEDSIHKARMIDDAMKDLSGTLTDIAFDFQNASNYAKQFFDQLARNLTQQLIMQPFTTGMGDVLKGLPGSIGTWLHGGGSTISTTGAPAGSFDVPTQFTVPEAHRGGRLGYDSFPMRRVPSSIFADAPRLHGGGAILKPGEVPVIAKAGEEFIPAGGSRSGPANLKVQIKNEGGSPVQAESAGMSFDAGEMVVNILLKDLTQGGRTRDYLRR